VDSINLYQRHFSSEFLSKLDDGKEEEIGPGGSPEQLCKCRVY